MAFQVQVAITYFQAACPQGDLNNDGMIDFDEFMRMMRSRQRKASEGASPLARARALLYRRYDN